ncbi:MAG: hypothetical protein UV78_C0049G0011 [Parcubacteria group bacterium GW2011_GWA2_43_17]|nr:MAG: hypothetical protein UV78_C0049G0011 [Parcubacteria group bacterium GW2011_GWA2_43_17]KKT90099.1 MAG: hypothetical protein UW91_C0064G0006 [Parcubacteria group bacterium GW2011_GWF2_45_11]KKT97546.1 MAG: hypothetical protein UW98_C0016G0015 [Parcubacteria group bacterium GW2011_GWC2_45_15]OGY96303.1 MAG: hypothetical protein A3J95_02120 [Candidatus Komeilibacteria bacterium RIFOXYC2_FULL_45_12]HBR13470.1 hypothetical protein [Candidatus Komeilibacteria bacterium]
MVKKFFSLTKIILGLALLVLLVWLYRADFGQGRQIDLGITFSQKYAEELNLDWREVYLAILDELKVKKIRLVAYWDLLEEEPGKYNFSDLDWAINQAVLNQAEVILAIGQRVPRWPECHWPDWSFTLSQSERERFIKGMITAIVNRYKETAAITAWQVENEPFLKIFGQCPKPDLDFYRSELELVRALDSRPVIVTESGELSTWLRAAYLADEVGVSVYRITWNKALGYFYYPLPPAYYYLKAWLVRHLSPVENVFVSEMQMEPWLPMIVLNTPLGDQYHSMDLAKFRKNFLYANRTGLSPIYFWGAEWWYWLKEQGDDSIWRAAVQIFNSQD